MNLLARSKVLLILVLAACLAAVSKAVEINLDSPPSTITVSGLAPSEFNGVYSFSSIYRGSSFDVIYLSSADGSKQFVYTVNRFGTDLTNPEWNIFDFSTDAWCYGTRDGASYGYGGTSIGDGEATGGFSVVFQGGGFGPGYTPPDGPPSGFNAVQLLYGFTVGLAMWSLCLGLTQGLKWAKDFAYAAS